MEKNLQIDPNDTPFRNYYKVNDFHKIVKDIYYDQNKEFDLLSYYSSGIFESFLRTASLIIKTFGKSNVWEMQSTDLMYYNEYMDIFESLVEKIGGILTRLEKPSVKELTYLDEDSFLLSNLGIGKTGLIDYPVETHIENVSRFKNDLATLVRNDKQLFNVVCNKVKDEVREVSDEDKLHIIISGFRKYIKDDKNVIYDQTRAQALKFKKNRQELLSKKQWVELADFEDMVINDILKNETIKKSSYDDLFDPYGIKYLKDHDDILYLLIDTTDPEQLYDFKKAYYAYNLLDFIDKDNINFFYHMVHRQNLIKCQIFDHLKVEYDKFINEENEQDSNVAHNPDGVKKWVDEIMGKTRVLLPKMSLTEVQYEKLWTKICNEEWAIKELCKYEPRTQKWGNIKFVASVLCLLQNTLVDPRDKTGKMMLDANAYEIGRALGSEKYRAYVNQEYLTSDRKNRIKTFFTKIY